MGIMVNNAQESSNGVSSKVSVHIIEGRNLVPKDRNIMGVPTSSDPYIILLYNGKSYGRTRMVRKTLSPSWDETIIIEISQDDLTNIQRGDKLFKNLSLLIYDKDVLSKDDFMGEVTIPLNFDDYLGRNIWYDVGTGSEPLQCENATGEIQVRLSIIEDT